MKISEDQVRHVAQLACVELEDVQLHEISESLSTILLYMDTLNEIDTSGVSPSSHIGKLETVFREDEVKASLAQDEALRNAPDRAGAFYRVPKILE
ncbi:Asp-tRNA(Asn)/Glu-tRNA(Gln) amidotransferase GatCAB subunit C [candidate division KSB3 bacterium]|uniref:Aspartyl/glutamyl-tRNA(Asn/Gln) amidotransferase subunit C n=1 Tax=candidate division KSB3 bacterium TaxID=2044937 RepID=A0A2G6E8Z8_9BACT|nr:MAG: Asp-tRNA(Asn)/Glu-tRNA(Gln) amidotransferase GatCAB subunit C [candidate division KSB3 bacterium]PIE29514.1 MAG: Asp-tRNA(Asn)/Glu-tRNA(Gln) amidotransferase GatCAB subunit C [candidate division KSB3 bacterium]